MVYSVKFKDNGKSYLFKCDGIEISKGDSVIVETEKGEQFGKVYDVDVDPKKISVDSMKPIIRLATDKDYDIYLANLKSAKSALDFARREVQKLNIDMRILDASYTFDKKQLTLNFIADERIDFRELVKNIAAKYKTRIELHQMGIRDKSKEIGGLGHCGRELCCSKFLNEMDTISINMAKNQNIALNPNKINGACGRLLCCLVYEDEVYSEHRKCLPKMNEKIKKDGFEGKVTALDILNKRYTLTNENGDKMTYDAETSK